MHGLKGLLPTIFILVHFCLFSLSLAFLWEKGRTLRSPFRPCHSIPPNIMELGKLKKCQQYMGSSGGSPTSEQTVPRVGQNFENRYFEHAKAVKNIVKVVQKLEADTLL